MNSNLSRCSRRLHPQTRLKPRFSQRDWAAPEPQEATERGNVDAVGRRLDLAPYALSCGARSPRPPRTKRASPKNGLTERGRWPGSNSRSESRWRPPVGRKAAPFLLAFTREGGPKGWMRVGGWSAQVDRHRLGLGAALHHFLAHLASPAHGPSSRRSDRGADAVNRFTQESSGTTLCEMMREIAAADPLALEAEIGADERGRDQHPQG